eukprot:Nitzschia sp. Nitz4//scaffold234_size30613//26550//27578//NITZ4_007967-RA/size30613-processed-gene-0.37-mRNA-1//1//CDS//3329543428//4920//frame0
MESSNLEHALPSTISRIPSTASFTSVLTGASDPFGSEDSVLLHKAARDKKVSAIEPLRRQRQHPGREMNIQSGLLAKILCKDIWHRDVVVVRQGLHKVAEIAREGTPIQKEDIVRFNCISSILRIMDLHYEDDKVQILACDILDNLSDNLRYQRTVAELGGLSTLARLLEGRNQRENTNLTLAVCRAMDSVSRACQNSLMRKQGIVVPTEGAIRFLTNCLKDYADNMDIQSHAFCALGNICIDHSREIHELETCGAIPSMRATLSRKWRSKAKKEKAVSMMTIILKAVAANEVDKDRCNDDESQYVEFMALLQCDSDDEESERPSIDVEDDPMPESLCIVDE